MSFTAPMQLTDLTSQPQRDGIVEFTDGDGKPAGELGVPVMWGSTSWMTRTPSTRKG